MKRILKVLAITFWSAVTYAQCDSVEIVLEGDFITNTVKNPVVKIDKGTASPVIGQDVKISKYFETTLFGFNSTGYMSIANAKVTKVAGQNITFKVVEETSNVTVNGKKKNQFEKGNHVKIEWKEKPQIETHLKMENGDTTLYGQLLCGKRTGEWRWYYANNKVEATEYYVNGKLNGPVREYYKSGALKNEANYVDGKIEGMGISYYESGEVYKKITFVNGKKEGKFTKYYENGNIKFVENYKDGNIYGEAKDYYENGKIKSIVFYDKDGEFDGEVKYYRENGNLKYERVFKHGEKTGYYKGYYENGKPFIVATTVKDKYNGAYKEYFDNGTLKFEGTHDMGKRTGFWKQYYENGQLHIQGEMKDDHKVGYWEAFYPDGKPKSKGTYDEEGNKIGKWFTWDENGKKTKSKYKK